MATSIEIPNALRSGKADVQIDMAIEANRDANTREKKGAAVLGPTLDEPHDYGRDGPHPGCIGKQLVALTKVARRFSRGRDNSYK